MPTLYPSDLPAVPDDRWNADRISETEYVTPDEGWGQAVTYYAIDATHKAEAEKRVLAWIDHDYEDDLRKSTAEAVAELASGRWQVKLTLLGEW